MELTKFLFRREDLALGYHSMKFRDSHDISYFPKILSLKSFSHSWRFVSLEKISKNYEDDCLQNFVLFFMCLLTVPIVKNSHI